MKKFIAICLAMILCVSLLSVTALADAYANISVSNATTTRGGEVTLNVNLTNNPGIAGMDLSISYDETQLEKVSVTGNTAIGGNWTIINDAVWDNAGDSTYTGNILTLTFKVKDTATCGSTAKVTVSGVAGNWDGELVTVSAGTGSIAIDHVYGEWKVVTPATCTTEGTEESTCSVCGHTQTRAIAATGHAWGEWKVATPATCTTDGVEKRVCSACGEEETRVLTATGHNPGSAWHMDENNHWHECTCGSHFDEAAHTWEDKENYLGQTYKKCTVCGYETDPVGEIPDDVPPTGDITILYMGGALILLAIACTAVVIVKRKTV
jgi:hypothetical protein